MFYLLPFCLPFWAAFMTLSFKTVLNILTWVPSHPKSKESDDCVHWIVHVWNMLNLRSIQPKIRGTSLWWCVGWSLEEICRASLGATQTLAACRHVSHAGHRPWLVQSCCLPWPKLCRQCRPRMIRVERDVSERRRASQRRNRSSVKNIGPTLHILRQNHISMSVSVGDPNLAIFNHFSPTMKSCSAAASSTLPMFSQCIFNEQINSTQPYELRWPCKVQLNFKGCTLLSLVLQLRNQKPSASTPDRMGRNMPNISKSLQKPGSVWPRWFVLQAWHFMTS